MSKGLGLDFPRVPSAAAVLVGYWLAVGLLLLPWLLLLLPLPLLLLVVLLAVEFLLQALNCFFSFKVFMYIIFVFEIAERGTFH